jgi:uncharacterized lipoprotein YajG
VRFVVSAVFSAACALSLAHCSHRENTLAVSPPLPPAEEPKDDVAGAYVDAGAPGAPEVKDERSEEEE